VVATVFEYAVVSAAGHGRGKAGVVGVKEPTIAPAPLDVFVEYAAAVGHTLGIAFLPDGLHQLTGCAHLGVGGGDGVVQARKMALHPRGAVAGPAGAFQSGAAHGRLLVADQKSAGRRAVQIGGQRQSRLIANDGGIRRLGLGMGIDQTEDAPAQPIVHLMGTFADHLTVAVHHQADVAHRAGRGCKILAGAPGHMVEIPLILNGREDIAVFAGGIDLVGRDIRTGVALLAGVWFTRGFDGKMVPGVASAAGPPAAIRIDTTHALVGPPFEDREDHFAHIGVTLFSTGHLQTRAVAVIAAIGPGHGVGRCEMKLALFYFTLAQDCPFKIVIQRIAGEVAIGRGHDVARILLPLDGVADRAIVGTDHHMDLISVVLEGVFMGIPPQGMAFGTPHAGVEYLIRHLFAGDFKAQSLDLHGRLGRDSRMTAAFPVRHDAGMNTAVAIHTLLCGRTEGGIGGQNQCDGKKKQESDERRAAKSIHG